MEPWLENFARACFQRSADTAHDLKTPLNVAVLNLELLRMRLRKIGGEDDEKIVAYTRAIEAELRRLGEIFDSFFILSIPPKNDGAPVVVDVAAIAADEAAVAGFPLLGEGAAPVLCHEARIRQACKLFFEGAAKLFAGRHAEVRRDGDRWTVTAFGTPEPPDGELTKLFKLYYTDAAGNPDPSLAVARLIAETYGGELNAVFERDKVALRLSLPVGAQ
jgi:hypothetical protein